MKVSGKDDQYNVTLKDVLDANSKSILKKATTDPDTGNVTYATTGQYLSFGGNEVTYEVSSAGVISFTSNPPQVLKFNGTTGKFTSIGDSTAGITNLLLTDGAAGNPFTNKGTNIDFSALSMFASSGSSSIKPTRGDTDGHGAGNAPGSMNGLTVQGDGKIYGVYTNGDQKLLGQIALATFANPSSLEAVGSSLFAVTQNSGDFDGVGVDASSIGGMSVGALEMSNVDLSTEFTNMIVTQRGFQANSRIITTSDTMLEELINLKR
jgi:flagellar hook protein FlgE